MECDFELLEMAAKAAGYTSYGSGKTLGDGPFLALREADFTGLWAPLTDDGDALRLANKLWLEVRHSHGQVHAGLAKEFWCTETWFPDGDQDAATRRAIVRAAATIWKAMP